LKFESTRLRIKRNADVMAEVYPFRGVTYNPSKIKDHAAVIAPPFDVISKKEQDGFYEQSPYNVVRLILGKHTDFDTRKNNPHTRAAGYLKDWLAKNVLIRDDTPAVYLTSVEFSYENQTHMRLGLIARVRLHAFEAGVVLPHERTFTNVKSERLALMKACRANFSPIFSMVADEDESFLARVRAAADTPVANLDFQDQSGWRYRMWRLTDPAWIRDLQRGLQDQRLFIADGHHRYETALNYRNWLRETDPNWAADHPASAVMMYLTSMRDPGLIIRPAHRMLKDIPRSTLKELIPTAQRFFKVEEIGFPENERRAALEVFIQRLRSAASETSLGVYMKGKRSFFLLTLKHPDVMSEAFGDELHPALRNLDVTVLTRLIFMQLMGFDQSRLDNEKLIGYTTEPSEAVQGVVDGEYDASFILNATSVQQVREIALQGLFMPRKATYFYPKVITGLVMNLLDG
jgi:uncharacterized protein (DUF1015 family)